MTRLGELYTTMAHVQGQHTGELMNVKHALPKTKMVKDQRRHKPFTRGTPTPTSGSYMALTQAIGCVHAPWHVWAIKG